MAFSRDVVAGNTPPTISVNEGWWGKEDRPVPTETVANAEVAKLQSRDTSITKASPEAEIISITRTCIMPLALAHPLLMAPYLSLAAAYTLLAARVHTWKWDAPIKPLMTWLRASLYAVCPGIKSLPLLDLAYHITVSRKKLLIEMVPRTPSGTATPSLTYIIQIQPAAQAAPENKKDPAERWDLQAPYLYRLANVQGSEDLPDIWKTLAPLKRRRRSPPSKLHVERAHKLSDAKRHGLLTHWQSSS